MLNSKKQEFINEATMRIFESLYKVAESNSIEELDSKVNIILDALGLEYNKEDNKEEKEEVIEDKIDEEDKFIDELDDTVSSEEEIEETEDTLVVPTEESLKSGKYALIYDSGKKQYFNNLDSLPIDMSYRSAELLSERDKQISEGILLRTPYGYYIKKMR